MKFNTIEELMDCQKNELTNIMRETIDVELSEIYKRNPIKVLKEIYGVVEENEDIRRF